MCLAFEGLNKSIEGLNNSLLVQKNVADFSNPDVQRIEKKGRNIMNSYNDGVLTFISPLSKADEIVPPFGIAKYSTKEREDRLQQIASLKINGQKKINPGCSLILTLIADELRESYTGLQTKLYSNQNGKAVFGTYKVNIECLIGLVSTAARLIGKFNNELNVETKVITPKVLQNLFVSNRRFFLTDNNIPVVHASIIQKIFNTPEGKRCLGVLNLLEDFVTQEMHRLFTPISESLDLSEHYSRLRRRADCFLNVLNDEEGFGLLENSVVKKYSVLFRRQKKYLIDFCNVIIPEIAKLQNKNDHKNLAELWRKIGFIRLSKENVTNRKALVDELELELAKNPNDIQLNLLYRICLRLQWTYSTLIDETNFVMLINLIEASHVSISEIDACMENLIITAKATISLNIDNIELRLQNLPKNDLTEAFSRLCNVDAKKLRDMFYLPTIHHLEIRLERCQKNPGDLIERALALRDVFNFLEDIVCTSFEKINVHMGNIRPMLELEDNNLELLKIHQDMHDHTILQHEGIIAGVEGIKSLIGRCFTEMESYNQIEDEKTSKILTLKSQQAKQKGDELIKSQNNSSKKRKGKKKGDNSQIPVSHVKSQEKQSQKVISSPKVISVDRAHFSNKLEFNKIQPKHTTPKNQIESDFENLPETTVSLFQCEIQLRKLIQARFVGEDCWQHDQVLNLGYLLESLVETIEKNEFSVDLIFEHTDLLRRSIEALLIITTVYIEMSPKDVKAMGHDTERLLGTLMGDKGIPENIRKLIWKMRNVPISLADANRCVNYPAGTKIQQESLGEDGRQLINYLMEVEREGRSHHINENSRISLTKQLNGLLQRGAYFMERLLTALLDPSKVIDGELPIEKPQKNQEKSLVTSESSSVESLPETLLLCEDVIIDKIKIFEINKREEALLAIDTALIWISIRGMAPVEGNPFRQWRTEERNIALQNSGIYLRRLKEKLGPDRNLCPMSTILGQCQLIRRCQKELLIAALYHTDSFVDGQHIVEARDIRFTNSPCTLMKILRDVSSSSKGLPIIGNWMHRAHQILSYPASQGQIEGDFSATQLQQLIHEVRQKSRELRICALDETLVLENGKRKTPEKRLQKRIELVKANESQRIFPGLAAFLHTLKYGLSLPKHKYLNNTQ
ncbi:MAG: hypothetical protein H0T62_00725 [Parachlamydiaceae bacterium]|nr:hypothetical protein [Parachlamydiaceae bacterium]